MKASDYYVNLTAIYWNTGATKQIGLFENIDQAIKMVKEEGKKILQNYYTRIA